MSCLLVVGLVLRVLALDAYEVVAGEFLSANEAAVHDVQQVTAVAGEVLSANGAAVRGVQQVTSVAQAASSGSSNSCSFGTLFTGNVVIAIASAAIYFDLNVANPITIQSIEHRYFAPAGCTIEFYTRPGTRVGFERTPVGWTLVASAFDATMVANTSPAQAVFDYPDFTLSPGSYGVALRHVGCSPVYSSIGAAIYRNSDLTLTPGAVLAPAFGGGGSLFSPRTVNIRFDYTTNHPCCEGCSCDDLRSFTHSDTLVDKVCTSCADRKLCNDPKDISLTLPDGRLICGDVVNPDSNCRAPNLKINGWSSSTLTNANGQSVALTTDFSGCFAPTFANNTLVGFTNAQNGRSIVFSRNGQCWLKFIKPIVNAKRNTLQATTTVTISAAHLLPAVGGATGDPHITGPRGEHFEFQGRRAARYTMISGPKYFINAQMSVEQGDVHFMTQVHVRVGDVEFTAAQLSLFDATEKDLAPLNAKLAPHSANVTVVNRRHNGIVPLPPQFVLNLCGGQERIIVTAVKPSQRQVAAFHLFETTLYYNIEFEVAGCHDELDGVIGQLYQCKYNAQPFVYDAAVVEQRFAVENFDDVPASFKPRASCLRLQAHEDIVGGVAAFN